MTLVISVGEVEADDAESGVDQLLELVDLPASRSKRADDLCLTLGGVRLGQDAVQGDVSSAEFGSGLSDVGIAERHGRCCVRGWKKTKRE